MARRKSRRSRRHSRRRTNPFLSLANPRRSRRSHRRSRRSRGTRRHSNPSLSLGGTSGKDLVVDAIAVGAGYVGAYMAKQYVAPFLPLTGTSAAVGNIAIKVGTGVAGYMVLKQFGMRRHGRNFAIGAFASAALNTIDLVFGTGISMGEYLTPKRGGLMHGGARQRMALGHAMGNFNAAITPIPTARLAAGSFPTAFRRGF